MFYHLLQMEVQAFLDLHEISCTGSDAPRPILNFEEASFPGKVVDLVTLIYCLHIQACTHNWVLCSVQAKILMKMSKSHSFNMNSL